MNTKRIISLMLLVMMVFTSIPFMTSAAPSYWGFDAYETVDYPGAPEEITSYPTTIKRVSSTTYTMSSTIAGVGTISISLIEEAWGTFNLGNWILKDTNGTSHTFVGSSTDMEYVHQYYYSDSHVTWSGGNHGGEALESLKFYDGVTGNEISLAIGGTHTSNVIHCIEKTKLLHFPDQNPKDSINDYNNKSISYTEDQVYAKLTRKYTFTGPQIKLNVDYLYTKDSYHARNYIAMLPIYKKYGRNCDMIDQNGVKIKTIKTTDGTVYSDYNGPSNSGNAATRAVVYSTNYPKYQFDVRVTTLKDGLNEFKNANFKTAFWDMNSSSDKLYFTRFDESKKILHAKNSEVHTECIWLFRYSADGSLPTYNDGTLQGEAPISRNKTYNNPVSNAVQGDGSTTKYGALLTDGLASGTYSYSDDTWALLFKGKNADANGIGTIIIDLKDVYSITKFRAHLANATITQTLPLKSLKVYGSTDGDTYTNLGSLTINTGTDVVYWTEATAPDNTKARYVKFEFALDGNFAALNELEVYGVPKQRTNVAKSKTYTYDGVWVENGVEKYPDEGGKTLTDGILSYDGATYSSQEYLCFYTADDFYKTNGYGYITVDLGKSYTMDSFVADVATKAATAGVTAPKSVEILVSDDNEAWASAGVVTLTDTDAESHILATLTLETPVSARYVQYRFVANSVLFMIAEVEAYEYEEVKVEEPDNNLLLNKTYTTTAIHGDNTYPDENGKSLTDGEIANTDATYSNVAFVGFNAQTDDYKRDGYASITVDLGKAYNLNKFKTYLASENDANIGAGVRLPSYVEVFVSTDKASWKSVGKAYPESSTSEDCTIAVLNLTTAASARYIQYRIVSEKNWIMISEVKAYGEAHTHTAIDKWLSDSNNHWKECACGEDMNKASHTAGDWEVVTPATTEKAGEQVKKCTVCKYVLETKEIPQLTPEHTHSAVGGWESDKNNHWKECACGEDLNKAAHTAGNWEVVTPATTEKAGEQVKKCTVCQYVLETKEIPKLEPEHTHNAEGDWKYDKDNHWKDCSCGEDLNKASHTAGDWVVVTPATTEKAGEQVKKCSVCEYVVETKEIPKLEEETPVPEIMLGDVNDSKEIDSMDYVLVKRAYFGTFTFNDDQLKAADVNASGDIDSMDYVLIKRAYFGTFSFN